MLGRIAQSLFWLSRYVERAENMARLLEAGYRMSLTVERDGASTEHLVSMMQAAAVDEAFFARHEVADVATVARFMLFDTDNASSVKSCLMNARTNARAVRTAITSDMWESLNAAWLEYAQIRPGQMTGSRLPGLLQWIKQSSHQFRGALLGTILRNEGFAFSQMGNFIERADNTARILDMKYYVLLPRLNQIGGEVDVQQWTLILRAASAHRSYRHFYHESYKARNIAEFLILRPEMPRSLIFCQRFMRDTLAMLATIYGERGACHDAVAALGRMVEGNTMDAIFAHGLHEFLGEFIARNNEVARTLGETYNFY